MKASLRTLPAGKVRRRVPNINDRHMTLRAPIRLGTKTVLEVLQDVADFFAQIPGINVFGKQRRFGAEELEPRLMMDAAMAMAAEHAYFDSLLDPAQATNVAVQSGAWSDAATWSNRAVPTRGAKVLIPEGISVLYDAGTANVPNLAWIRDEGTIKFDDTKDENLLVETITVHMMGDFDIGTATSPFQHHATITFADNGTVADPNGGLNQLSRGLISEGCLCIYGTALTTFAPVSVNPRAGDTTLQFSSAPVNWQVGDTLLITGTVAGAHQDEEIPIKSISADGLTVTLASPLQYDHLAPSGLHPYVADEARTITFTSQNKTDSTRFGHIMDMMSTDARVNYAAIVHMGRTDKSQLIDDVVNYDQDDGNIPGGGTNVRGRYALHFHRAGTDTSSPPIQVVGNFLADSPGWGYVNHSSNVDFTDNVAYNVVGAAFVTETGGELGAFTHNLADYEKGAPDIAFDRRERSADWGYSGQGFSLMSGSVDMVNNISAGAATDAYTYVGISIHEGNGIGDAMVPAAALNDPLIAGGADSALASSVPIHSFYGNEAFASDIGIGTYSYRPIVTDLGPNVIEKAVVWGVGSYGINLDYTDNITLKDVQILNDGTGYKTGIRTNSSASNLTIVNAYVEGFVFGLTPSTQGATVITGGFWHNETDIYIGNATAPFGETVTDRSISISNVTFGTDPQEVWVDYELFANGFDLTDYMGWQGTFTINGQTVYAAQQVADYIAFPTMADLPSGYPKWLVGMTNQQIMDQYGMAAGGAIAPTDAVSVSNLGVLVGGTAS